MSTDKNLKVFNKKYVQLISMISILLILNFNDKKKNVHFHRCKNKIIRFASFNVSFYITVEVIYFKILFYFKIWIFYL